ncbi:UDP-N-acetylmuramoyl-tripeptide--D-alanyl-D-alanine ligase [hydrothermal vent metagenome]|uniref:UDP-MurNAc-pentapeptide synthetase n=1 Tax=hydrothermal vent metagenome TaxID=652676 RepID=A0A3B0VUT0_9ZZZZ
MVSRSSAAQSMKFTVRDILEATGGRLERGSEDTAIKGVSIDSRTIRPGEVFFAISGKNFDGHSFVAAAVRGGAKCVVVEVVMGDLSGYGQGVQAKPGKGADNVVVVRDALRAMGGLAAKVRAGFKRPLIAVTGSSGKTTTREMIASILSRCGSVLQTEGNKNNLVGVPLTLFGLDDKKGSAVVELGISEPGEMRRLAWMTNPDVALITNIGRSHMEGLGSLENAAKEKLELYDAVAVCDRGGVVVVNLDDERIAAYAEGVPQERVVTFGSKAAGPGVDVLVREAVLDGDNLKVDYLVRGQEVEVVFRSPCLTNAINGAAAIAATLPLGVEAEDAACGLSSFTQPAGRMEVLEAGGVKILDDSYNANPDSEARAVMSLVAMAAAAGRRSVAILGDMLELGSATERLHRELGALVAGLKVDLLVTVGPESEALSIGAKNAGMCDEKVMHFAGNGLLVKALKGVVAQGDIVLVKGSRSSRMEEVVEGILKGFLPQKSWRRPGGAAGKGDT